MSPSWAISRAISHYSQCSTTGVAISVCGIEHYILKMTCLTQWGVRCSSVVECLLVVWWVFGSVLLSVSPSWAISHSSQCSTTGVAISVCGIEHYILKMTCLTQWGVRCSSVVECLLVVWLGLWISPS